MSVDPRTHAVREFWNAHVDHWKVAREPVGTLPFFEEIEAYRFEKLQYLSGLIPFEGCRGKRLLEVGCGVGNDLSRLARAGAVVSGIDLAERSIELARRNFELRGLTGEFQRMDGEAMTFADQSFDHVYCHTVLHFTPDPQRMIREIHRVLRPGGQAILMTVNRSSWLRFMHRLFKVRIDHLDSPVFHWCGHREFRAMLEPFAEVTIVPERFPVATKVHEGPKARLFNGVFIGAFALLPRVVVRRFGHHLIAFAKKAV